jgi:hypothetical protein
MLSPEREQRLMNLASSSRVNGLLLAMVPFAFTRRPASERQGLIETIAETLPHGRYRREVELVVQTIADAFIEEGREQGQRLAAQTILRRLLTKRFGELPPATVELIEAVEDLDRLYRWVENVPKMRSLRALER